MKIIKTKFKDLIIIEQGNFVDYRGELRITFHQKNLNVNKFVFEYSVTSKKNVIRGLHFQYKFQQAKLVYVLKGKILDVVVDLRQDSVTFGQWVLTTLEADMGDCLYVPDGFGHGFLSLEDNSSVVYNLTSKYQPEMEFTINLFDPTLKINWPDCKPIISQRDLEAPNFLAAFLSAEK
mgnify:CR=1 FL=1